MNQQEGWEDVEVHGFDRQYVANSWEQVEAEIARRRGYRYEWRTVRNSRHKFRRTARKHARLLNDHRTLEESRDDRVLFTAEKSRRGPFAWHVQRRTKVPVLAKAAG